MENTNQKIKKINDNIFELVSVGGVSADENAVATVIEKKLNKICDSVKIDKNGNVIGYIYSDLPDAKTMMFEAHMDRIGLMITGIDDNGFLEFTTVGGVDKRILPFSEVEIAEKSISGIILVTEDTKEKNADIEQMKIKCGYDCEYIRKNIKCGDFAVIKSDFINMCNNNISCGALDNRAGIAAVLNTIENIEKEKLKYNIAILFSVQEELGLHGAYTGTRDISPDVAIVIDVTHGETSDTKNETGVFKLGCGAVICKGPNFHRGYTDQLIKLAESLNLPYEIEVAAGPSGTSAWAVQISGNGVPSMLISIPLRYMHTNVETINLNDVLICSELMKSAAEGGLNLD